MLEEEGSAHRTAEEEEDDEVDERAAAEGEGYGLVPVRPSAGRGSEYILEEYSGRARGREPPLIPWMVEPGL